MPQVTMQFPRISQFPAPRFFIPPRVARSFFLLGAGLTLLSALLIVWTLDALSLDRRLLTAAPAALLGALLAWSGRRPLLPQLQTPAFMAALVASSLTLAAIAAITGTGLQMAALGLLPLLVALAGLLVGRAHAILLACVSAALVLALARWGPRPDTLVGPVSSGWARAVWHLFAIACATATAFLIDAVLKSSAAQMHLRDLRYSNLFARSPLAVVTHRHGRVLMANDAALRLLGYARSSDLVGHLLSIHYEAADHERMGQRLARAMSLPPGGTIEPADFKLVRCDGSSVYVTVASSRVELDDGPACESIYLDVSELRHNERALLRSGAMLSRLITASPDIITVTVLATGRYLLVNPMFERVSGYGAAEVLNRTPLELGLLTPAERERLVSALKAGSGLVQDLPTVYHARSGRDLAVSVSAAVFDLDGQACLVAIARDVTEREAERSEHEAILANASVGIAFTRNRQFRRVNRRFEEMLGWPLGSLAGQPVAALWSGAQEHAEVEARSIAALAEGRPLDGEWHMHRRDGSRFWCRVRAQSVGGDNGRRGGTIWILEDVTERRRVERELASARDAAEAASRAKSAFLANMSHEIRTPLHGLMGLAELARNPELPEARRTEYLARLVDSARALSAVINDILDLSKIEAGRLDLEYQPFDLKALCTTVAYAQEPVAHQRGLALSVSFDEALHERVLGDAVRLRQILDNFLSNALKFTLHGSVSVHVQPAEGERVRFKVRDSGPGIDAATQARLFQPFVQADESVTRRYGGTGLGLAICRELARLMGGEVGVVSEPNAGSEFWVELPLPAAPAADATAPPSSADGSPADGNGSNDRALEGARVLVVEDNPVNMLIADSMLRQWGVEVLQAGDGYEAIEVVGRECGEPGARGLDLVLMDVHMPRLSGDEATVRLRERWDAQSLPIVALTAAALVAEQQHALAVGMNDFVTKPIESQRLRDVVLRWVRRPLP
jgi:PAS domain S-box-containing protein